MAVLVFDVNGTLSDMSPLGDEFESCGLPPGLAATWFASLLRDGFALSLPGSAPPFLTLAREVLVSLVSGRPDGHPVPEEVADRVLQRLSELGVHADVAPGLRALHAAGHTLVAFTNGSADGARGLLRRANVLDLFSEVLSVESSGTWKPHPDAYRRAAETLALEPQLLTMVAAHPWDLDGASRCGLRTAFVDRTGAGTPTSFTPPDITVTTLGDLEPELGDGR